MPTTPLHVTPPPNQRVRNSNTKQIAGFFTGGSLAIRGGYKAARNGAISCAILLAVIEGVGIGFQKMFAGATKLEVSWMVSPRRVQTVLTSPRPRHRHRRTKRCSHRRNDGARTSRHGDNSTTQLFSSGSLRTGRVFSYAFMTVSIIGGGVPCNIELVGYALPYRVRAWKPRPAETSAEIISLFKAPCWYGLKSRVLYMA